MNSINWEQFWRTFLPQYNHTVWALPDPPADSLQETNESGWLGYPEATDEQITAAEERIGVTLPPSYRAFLRTSNGWCHAGEIGLRLFSTEEIDWYSVRAQDEIDAWLDGARAYYPEQPFAPDAAYFVYDVDGGRQKNDPLEMYFACLPTTLQISTEGDGDVYLLNPRIVTVDGEWEAWHMTFDGAFRWRSFGEMLARSAAPTAPLGTIPAHQNLQGLWPQKSVAAYIAALQDPDYRIRRQAVAALEVLRDRRAIEPLLHTLAHDDSVTVRGTAARALEKFGETRAIEPLLHILTHDLRSADEELRNAIFPALAGLTRLYQSHPAPPLAASATPDLIELLTRGDARSRRYAAWALGYVAVHDDNVREALTAALQDESADVRQVAAESLHGI